MITGRLIADICRELAVSAQREQHQILAQILRMAAIEANDHQAWHSGTSVRDSLVGTWDWDVVHDRIYADARFAELFGLELGSTSQSAPLMSWLAAIHPDDVEDVGRDIEATLATGTLFSREYRVVAHGETRWVYARGRSTMDENGKAIRFPGAIVDITHEKIAASEAPVAPT